MTPLPWSLVGKSPRADAFTWLPSSYDNPYDSFRQKRSSGYYDAITRNSVDAMVKRGERFGGGR